MTEIGKALPSTLAASIEFSKITGPGHDIAYNRPFEYNTLPLVLLHEAFGIFKDRCKAAPSARALAFLNELAVQACKWYLDKTSRRSAIQTVFAHSLGLQFREKVSKTEFTTDGNLVVIVMPAAVRECKSYTGNALSQVIRYYCRFLEVALIGRRHFYNSNTSFPCILMVDMGMSAL